MTRAVPTRPADSLRWIKPDLLVRLLPFAAVVVAAWVAWRPAWLGLEAGDLGAQLLFAAIAGPVLFAGAAGAQLLLSRRRGSLLVPASGSDLWLQAAFYCLNGPLEEGFFRGLVQGGLGHLLAPWAGFLVATAAYVLYHRLGRWPWPDVAATALLGVPLGLAFWLLPGPPSLLGVSLVHAVATSGFLGPGPWLLRRLGLLG